MSQCVDPRLSSIGCPEGWVQPMYVFACCSLILFIRAFVVTVGMTGHRW
jgi:hypothetical protein